MIIPKVIDAFDILLSNDEAGIDKIASLDIEEGVLENAIHNRRQLSDTKYACIIKTASETLPKFPIDSKGTTLLSITGFNHTNETLPDEIVKVAATNLLKAAYHWGITSDLDGIKKHADKAVKSNTVSTMNERNFLHKTAKAAPSPSHFALEGRYPIDTPELMKTAEGYFRQYSDRFSPVESYTFAKSMIKQAKALDYQIAEKSILKYANLRYEQNPSLTTLLKIRDTKAETDGAYTKVAKLVGNLPLEKIAEAVLELDQEFGLDRHYNKIIPDPIFTVFNTLEKVSEQINGKDISLESLRAIPRENLSKYLNDSSIDELHGDHGLDVLASLPEPVIEDIISHI
jgi:hypothetical protein